MQNLPFYFFLYAKLHFNSWRVFPVFWGECRNFLKESSKVTLQISVTLNTVFLEINIFDALSGDLLVIQVQQAENYN